MLRIQGVEIPGKKKGKGKGQPGADILSEARDSSQGDVFAALDGLIEGIEGSLAVAGKITSFGSREKEEDTQIDAKTIEEETSATEETQPEPRPNV
jgi:hypothetical protein